MAIAVAIFAAPASAITIAADSFDRVNNNTAGNNEGFTIDNFALTGDPITVIPLPGTMLLLLCGFGGLAAMGRGRKTA